MIPTMARGGNTTGVRVELGEGLAEEDEKNESVIVETEEDGEEGG
jgi:hypothetical protein